MKLAWLNEGSIHLLCPEVAMGRWRGAEERDDDDYSRACEHSDDWLNKFSVGGEFALILGGEPAMVAVHRPPDGRVLLIRWLYADSESDLLDLVLTGIQTSPPESCILFENVHSRWQLRDAASHVADDCVILKVPMPIGRVRAVTNLLKKDAAAAIVHQLIGESGPE